MKNLYILLVFICVSCGDISRSKKIDNVIVEQNIQTKIPVIDIEKDYPDRIISLNDIASIQYIPLETLDNTILSAPRWISSSQSGDTIVLGDWLQKKIFVFDARGKCLNAFKRQGGSGEEYQDLCYLIVDFQKKEIFVWDNLLKNRIVIYSFNGAFKRELQLTHKVWPEHIFNYDADYLIGYDILNLDHERKQVFSETPYFLISKTTGEVKFLPIHLKERLGNSFWFYSKGNNLASSRAAVNIYTMIKHPQGIIISDFMKDTVYNYTNHQLMPLAIHNSLSLCRDNPWLFSCCLYSDQYLFFQVLKKKIDKTAQQVIGEQMKVLMYDKKEGKTYSVKMQLPDILGSENILWTKYGQDHPTNGFIYPMPVDYLFELNQRGKIKGDLKKLLSRLKEDDNHVLIMVNFK